MSKIKSVLRNMHALPNDELSTLVAYAIQECGRRGRDVMPRLIREAQELDDAMFEEFVAWVDDPDESK